MFDIQKTSRLHDLCGLSNNQVDILPDIYCVRKYMEPKHKEWNKFRKIPAQNVFAFVSHPKMPSQQIDVMKNIKFWCHPFRERQKYLLNNQAKYILLPESDFMDANFVDIHNSKKTYDFFYFTLNSRQGIEYKGLKTFVNMLPILCGKLKKKGIVIVYYPAVGIKKKLDCLPAKYKKEIEKYSAYLDFVWGWQTQSKTASIMSKCKFGLFPNEIDCSPRMIPETILRNIPVLVNKDILGGWHYLSDETGFFFEKGNKSSYVEAIKKIDDINCQGRDYFMSKWGFSRSSSILRNFLLDNNFDVEKYSNIYFSCYKNYMSKLC